MRQRLAAALLLTLTLAVVPAFTAAPAGTLRVTELLVVPDAAQGQREFVEVWNPTSAPVDLAGWSLQDAPTAAGSINEYTFASGRLAPGARIVVWSNGSADARGPAWSTSPSKTVWNDAGDAVTLLDPSDVVADWLAYGNSAQTAPAGFEAQAKPAAPARGVALARDGDAWSSTTPSPGLAPGVVGGMAGLTVTNVPPTATVSGLPATVKPGQAVDVVLSASDGNGAADLASWALTMNGAAVAQGSGAPASPFHAVAPAVSGPWSFTLAVVDSGGLTAQHAVSANVRDARLSLLVAGGLLRFPDLAPGATNVTALDWATLRNEGADPVTPLLDVSPFAGPADIPVDRHLSVGLVATADATPTWIAYEGPLTALPAIAAGASLRMTLRLDEVPAPLAAGTYGTTFAVVAA